MVRRYRFTAVAAGATLIASSLVITAGTAAATQAGAQAATQAGAQASTAPGAPGAAS